MSTLNNLQTAGEQQASASRPTAMMRFLRRRKPQAWERLFTFLRRYHFILLIIPFFGLLSLRPPTHNLRGTEPELYKPSLPLAASVKERLNAQVVDADEILEWAVANIPHSHLIQVTSFGPSGLVILDKLKRRGVLDRVPVVTIDTLHLFPETYDFLSRLDKHFDTMNLKVFRPSDFEDREEFEEEYGEDLWKTNPGMYSYLTKVEPMMRALDDLNASAWITGRRASQGGERAMLQTFEVDSLNPDRLKINPLAHWSYKDVWDYIRKNNVPYNPLHDKGYKSIGDEMTTIAVAPDTDERSGRFVGMNTTECGMHSHFEKVKKMRQDAEKHDRVFRAPPLPCADCLDVDSKTFHNFVINAEKDVLLEFYSPFCGACQEFAPQYKQIAKQFKHVTTLQVSRFDMTANNVSDFMIRAGFDVAVTPTLFFVQHNPFQVSEYDGDHDIDSILIWIGKKNSNYVTI